MPIPLADSWWPLRLRSSVSFSGKPSLATSLPTASPNRCVFLVRALTLILVPWYNCSYYRFGASAGLWVLNRNDCSQFWIPKAYHSTRHRVGTSWTFARWVFYVPGSGYFSNILIRCGSFGLRTHYTLKKYWRPPNSFFVEVGYIYQ